MIIAQKTVAAAHRPVDFEYHERTCVTDAFVEYVCAMCFETIEQEVSPIQADVYKTRYTLFNEYFCSVTYQVDAIGGWGTLYYQYTLLQSENERTVLYTSDYISSNTFSLKTTDNSSMNDMVWVVNIKDDYGNEASFEILISDDSLLSETQSIAAVTHTYINHTCRDCQHAEPPITSYDISLDLDGSLVAKLYAAENGLYELYIVGAGQMVYSSCPWSAYAYEITKVHIDDGVTSIGQNAFSNFIRLTTVTIPSSISSIGYRAFYRCTALSEIHFLATSVDDLTYYNEVFRYAGQNSTGITVYIGGEVTKIPNYLFNPTNSESDAPKVKEIVFKDGSTCKEIGTYSFAYLSYISNLSIPDSVISIGVSAFAGCGSLETIELPFVGASSSEATASEQTLLGYIFGSISYTGSVSTKQYYSASDHKTYYIPANLVSVKVSGGNLLYGSFYNCVNIKNVIIGDRITRIEDCVFAGCTSLETISLPCADSTSFRMLFNTIPESLASVTVTGEYISDYYFSGANEDICANITISESVKEIGAYAFYLSSGASTLTEITIPNSVTKIGEGAFRGTALKYVVIPDSVTSIGSSAFQGCDDLVSVVIGNGTAYIGSYCFYACYNLTDITVGNSVTKIGDKAFGECKKITSCHLPGSITDMGYAVFYGCSSLERITIPFVGRSTDEKYTSEYTLFGYIFGKDSYSGGVATNQYYNYAYYTTYYIPQTLQSVTVLGGEIMYGAFYNCSKITEISVMDTATVIGDCAFYNCTNISSILIGKSVTAIGRSAFYGCDIEKNVYYEGDADWANTITSPTASITKATYYYYSSDEPTEADNYWYYNENGDITVW